MKDFGVHWVGGICGNSLGFPTGFSVSMGWVWELKFNSHGTPALLNCDRVCLGRRYVRRYRDRRQVPLHRSERQQRAASTAERCRLSTFAQHRSSQHPPRKRTCKSFLRFRLSALYIHWWVRDLLLRNSAVWLFVEKLQFSAYLASFATNDVSDLGCDLE